MRQDKPKNLEYLEDSKWLYWNKIQKDSYNVWIKGDFKSMSEENIVYRIMLEAMSEKSLIEDKYNQ